METGPFQQMKKKKKSHSLCREFSRFQIHCSFSLVHHRQIERNWSRSGEWITPLAVKWTAAVSLSTALIDRRRHFSVCVTDANVSILKRLWVSKFEQIDFTQLHGFGHEFLFIPLELVFTFL